MLCRRFEQSYPILSPSPHISAKLDLLPVKILNQSLELVLGAVDQCLHLQPQLSGRFLVANLRKLMEEKCVFSFKRGFYTKKSDLLGSVRGSGLPYKLPAALQPGLKSAPGSLGAVR
jgi:hypothetical protein